jgi:hypothetical protein
MFSHQKPEGEWTCPAFDLTHWGVEVARKGGVLTRNAKEMHRFSPQPFGGPMTEQPLKWIGVPVSWTRHEKSAVFGSAGQMRHHGAVSPPAA